MGTPFSQQMDTAFDGEIGGKRGKKLFKYKAEIARLREEHN